MVTDLADLSRLTTAILRDRIGFDAPSLAQMTAIDPTTGAGAGAFGFCPCTIDADGRARFASVGRFGGTTLVAYVAADGLTVVIDVTDTLWVDGRPESTGALVAVLSAIAARL